MPIYEYRCQSCDGQLEALQKISDEPLLECPQCGEAALKKKVSAAAFRLKGAGWYETDFKTGNKKNLAGGGEGAGSGDKAPAANSGDTKPSEGKSSASKSGDSKKTA
jgi:putative FmdB family regulatory protein